MSLVETITDAQARGTATRPSVGGFPHLAETLRQAGVMRIDVTVPSWTTVLTTADGSVLQQGTPMVDATTQVPDFDLDAFIAGLRADQDGTITFPEWMEATWRAGVLWYQVDLEARTCTYRSPAGDSYVERYPAVTVRASDLA